MRNWGVGGEAGKVTEENLDIVTRVKKVFYTYPHNQQLSSG